MRFICWRRAALAGLLVQLLMRNNWLTALLLCGGAAFLQGLLDWLLTCVLWRLPDSGQVLLRQYLPNFLLYAGGVPAAVLPDAGDRQAAQAVPLTERREA